MIRVLLLKAQQNDAEGIKVRTSKILDICIRAWEFSQTHIFFVIYPSFWNFLFFMCPEYIENVWNCKGK